MMKNIEIIFVNELCINISVQRSRFSKQDLSELSSFLYSLLLSERLAPLVTS